MGVPVGTRVSVGVFVGVGVLVGVSVGVKVGVDVAVGVGVRVGVLVDVEVGVGEPGAAFIAISWARLDTERVSSFPVPTVVRPLDTSSD